MFKNYLKTAFRQMMKHRQFTLLNLAGLSTGMACAVLIFLWVNDELRFDKFHANDPNLYQVMERAPFADGIHTAPGTPALMAETMRAQMPELKAATVITPPDWFPQVPLTVADKHVKAAGLFAGKEYLDVFTFPLLQGSASSALDGKDGIVITEKLARRLFHTTENVTGKMISWQIDQFKRTSIITGVLKNVPAASSLQFDFLLPFGAFKEMLGIQAPMAARGPFLTYVVLNDKAPVSAFNEKLSRFMGNGRDIFLRSYSGSYLYGNYVNGQQSGGRIGYVKLFSLIAIFILLIACINFVNLSTAKSAARMKEMGIRKSVGANRLALIGQYMGESLLMTLLALVFGLILVWLLLPAFNGITGKELALKPDAAIIGGLAGITLFTGIAAGIYPAFYLSGFRPVTVLKGNLQTGAGALWARKGLVVFQFALSVVFIVAVMVVYRQIGFMQSHNLGYDKDHVIYFDAEGRVPEQMETFLASMKNIPGVANASVMVGNVMGAPSVGKVWQKDTLLFRPFLLSYDMLELLDIRMAAGRTFSRELDKDRSGIIFNEAAVKAMGLKDPVGKIIDFGGQQVKVIGVTRNFHFQSLHEDIKPLFFQLENHGGTVMVKMKEGMEKKALAQAEALYKSFNPGFAFNYSYLDGTYQAQYIAERRVGALSRYAAALAAIISCLGLFGLAAYTAEKKRKEIGIRKVLGATVSNVVLMLSKDFMTAVMAAICLAVPVAWWLMARWLDGFAYHVGLGPDVFLLAAGGMVALTLATVSFQAVKAAVMNPVKSLRTE
ncbi:ABC transporter permease [Chitinophaga sp. 22620]|uniref:ABC transporter permease n=1 Tax=Chitinophaga sp. 22620 TaxID=3453952 RepID=UPI003F872DB1